MQYEYRFILKSNDKLIAFQTDRDIFTEMETAWKFGKNLTITINNDESLMIQMSEVAAIKYSLLNGKDKR